MDTQITQKKRKRRTVFVEGEKWLKVSKKGKTVDEEDYNAIKDIFDQLRNGGGKRQDSCVIVGERNGRIVSLMLYECGDNIFDHVSKLSALKKLNVRDCRCSVVNIPDSLRYAILCNRFKAVSRCSTGEKLWPQIISNAKYNSSAIHQLLTQVRGSFVEMLINRSSHNVDVPDEAHIFRELQPMGVEQLFTY